MYALQSVGQLFHHGYFQNLKLIYANRILTNKSGDIIKEVNYYLQQEWSSYLHIYDGAKDQGSGKMAFGVTIPELGIKN